MGESSSMNPWSKLQIIMGDNYLLLHALSISALFLERIGSQSELFKKWSSSYLAFDFFFRVFSRLFTANPFSTLASGLSTFFWIATKKHKIHKNLLISASQPFSFLLLPVTSNSLVTPQPQPLTFSPSWLSKKTWFASGFPYNIH